MLVRRHQLRQRAFPPGDQHGAPRHCGQRPAACLPQRPGLTDGRTWFGPSPERGQARKHIRDEIPCRGFLVEMECKEGTSKFSETGKVREQAGGSTTKVWPEIGLERNACRRRQQVETGPQWCKVRSPRVGPINPVGQGEGRVPVSGPSPVAMQMNGRGSLQRAPSSTIPDRSVEASRLSSRGGSRPSMPGDRHASQVSLDRQAAQPCASSMARRIASEPGGELVIGSRLDPENQSRALPFPVWFRRIWSRSSKRDPARARELAKINRLDARARATAVPGPPRRSTAILPPPAGPPRHRRKAAAR